jgi:tetratricopeptide (TPR) repeat protein
MDGIGEAKGQMTNDQLVNSSADQRLERWFDTGIEWLLVGLLTFMPFAFGAVEAWSEQVVIALAATISITFVVKLVLCPSVRFVWSWAYVTLGLFIAVAVFQLIPMPQSLVAAISPHTAAIKRELLSDLPNADRILSRMTFSFYPHATRHDLRLVLATVAVFVVVLNVYRRPKRIKRLLITIAVIGAAVAVLALAQDLLGNGKIYWLVPTGHSHAYSGPFINHSHFSQFMNLSIGAALAVILATLHEVFVGKKLSPSAVADYIFSHRARVVWLLVAMIALGAATVFVSLSRGGMVSMLVAAGFTTLILSSRKSLKGSGWIMVLMAIGAFTCVLYIGFDAVYDRLATLRELHQAEAGRWQIVKDVAIAWTKFPCLGTGLGTHAVVYPMFDRSTVPALAYHAENEYMQAAEETGAIGLGALLSLAILVWVNYIRAIKDANTAIHATAYGIGFGLVAVMVHSVSDFGQHLPSNNMLSAIFCALLLALAPTGAQNNRLAQLPGLSRARRPVGVAVLLGACGIWAWALLGANNARVAETYWRNALLVEQRIRQNNWQGSNAEYKDLISNAAAAAQHQPDNAKYRHWLNVYRWHSMNKAVDSNTGDLILPQETIKFTRRIVGELNQARKLCPVFGATYCFMGQLERLVLDEPKDGANHIESGYRLAPCDPTACFVAGALAAEQGDVDTAFARLQRAVRLDGKSFREAAHICVEQMDRPDLAVALAGDNTERLSHIANILSETGEHEALVEKARNRVAESLRSRCRQPNAPAWTFAALANICKAENNPGAAIEHYRRALALDYGQVHWRLALARLLADSGQVHEAIHQAKICLRLRPQFVVAKRLVEELSVSSEAMKPDNGRP